MFFELAAFKIFLNIFPELLSVSSTVKAQANTYQSSLTKNTKVLKDSSLDINKGRLNIKTDLKKSIRSKPAEVKSQSLSVINKSNEEFEKEMNKFDAETSKEVKNVEQIKESFNDVNMKEDENKQALGSVRTNFYKISF